MYSIRQPLYGMIRFMYCHVVRITRLRSWAPVLHASVSLAAWMVYISRHSGILFFIQTKMVSGNMIIPEAVKIPGLFKLKMACTYWHILPGIIKYPVYRLRFQKIFSIGRKKDLLSAKLITISFRTRPP